MMIIHPPHVHVEHQGFEALVDWVMAQSEQSGMDEGSVALRERIMTLRAPSPHRDAKLFLQVRLYFEHVVACIPHLLDSLPWKAKPIVFLQSLCS